MEKRGRSGPSKMRRATTSFAVLVLAVGASGTFSQELRDDGLLAGEIALTESIRQEELENGPYSEALIELYTSLSFFYEEAGDLALADATIERARQVIRANFGLDSLDQAPSIRRLMDHAELRGDALAVWNLEQELIGYANRQSDDLRSARVFRDTADRRMSILRRYDAGEYPPEIVLGCYYDDTGAYNELYRTGSTPLTALKDLDPVRATEQTTFRRCRSGSQSMARRALLLEAQAYYSRAGAVLLGNDEHSSAEFEELVATIVETSYRYGTPSIGRQGLLRLVDYKNDNSAEVLPRIEAMVQLADWDLLSSVNFGRGMAELALETYRGAYDLVREHDIDEESIDAIFAPEIPVMLPAFIGNPLEPEDRSRSETFIDVAFTVRIDGRADEIEVLQTSEDVSRVDERDLERLIKRKRFRPRIVEGDFAEAAPVTVRYFPSD